jgi:predicted phage terminase large subunit-like protein
MPYYHLMCMLFSEGESAFNQEMQNQPVDPQSCLFPRQWLQFFEPAALDLSHKRWRLYGYCDPSLGKSADGDYSAIVTIACDGDTGTMYVIDADLARRHPDVIIADILQKARDFYQLYGKHYTAFGAESNQFQWFLKEQLAKESARAGIYLPLSEVYAGGDKTLRIQTLQPDIKNGYLRFDPSHTLLLQQLEQFPMGRHDDGPDALQGAVALCKKGGVLGTVSGLRL